MRREALRTEFLYESRKCLHSILGLLIVIIVVLIMRCTHVKALTHTHTVFSVQLVAPLPTIMGKLCSQAH